MTLKPLCELQHNYGKCLKSWEYQTILPAPLEACIEIKKQPLEPDMEKWTGSKLGNKYIKICVLSPCLFNL